MREHRRLTSQSCIMCDEYTFTDERIYAVDFKRIGNAIPLCSTCEKDHRKYMHAVAYAKAYWKNK